MKRLQLVVEGQTEETLVEQLLIPHFHSLGWIVGRPLIVKTKRVVDGPDHKGGMSSWRKIRPQIVGMLHSNFDIVTTMFDYYALPDDTPGMSNRPRGDAYARVSHVEQEIADDIDDPRLLPNLALHETEALVFAARRGLVKFFDDTSLAAALGRIVNDAGGPELINDDPTTAPSKRLLQLIPRYSKAVDGPLAIIEAGLGEVRAECPHFDAWLKRIESAS